jgi:hypothetical protein
MILCLFVEYSERNCVYSQNAWNEMNSFAEYTELDKTSNKCETVHICEIQS